MWVRPPSCFSQMLSPRPLSAHSLYDRRTVVKSKRTSCPSLYPLNSIFSRCLSSFSLYLISQCKLQCQIWLYAQSGPGTFSLSTSMKISNIYPDKLNVPLPFHCIFALVFSRLQSPNPHPTTVILNCRLPSDHVLRSPLMWQAVWPNS